MSVHSTRNPVRLRSSASLVLRTTKSSSFTPGNTVSPPSVTAGSCPRATFNTTAPVAPCAPSTRIPYSRPASAVNVTRLAVLPAARLSLDPTSVSAPTADPVYTDNTVSNTLPTVSTVTSPAAGALHRHQIECNAPLPTGSPASPVAPVLSPVAVAFHNPVGIDPANPKASTPVGPNPVIRSSTRTPPEASP